MDLFFYKAALVLYLIGTLGYLLYMIRQDKGLARAAYFALLLGFCGHTLSIAFWTLDKGYFPIHGLREALSLFAWTLMGVFIVVRIRFNFLVLGSFLSPLAAVMMITSSFLPAHTGPVNPWIKNLWLMIHVSAVFIGNGAFAVSCMAGVMYLLQERQIKSRRPGGLYRRLPSLEVLDTLNYQCLILGFPLMTLGMLSGSVFAHYTLGSFWRWDPKEVWSLITWLLYAVLLHGRLVSGWRGRRSALIAIAGFLILIFSFIGLNLWGRGYHSFSTFTNPTVQGMEEGRGL
jgi:cytochrome c-type biogenesis protein CcsB